MAIRILTDVATLARSRFAISPAYELTATLAGRNAGAPSHARRWYARALARLDEWTLELLHALVPLDHPYVPDFLAPHPRQPRQTRDEMVAAIAATPADELALQLDFAFADRPVHPEHAESFGGEARYQRWRRRPPPILADLLGSGDAALAKEAAGAFGRFFDAALADDWAAVVDVLEADIAHRSEAMATHGLATMLQTLGTDLAWDGGAVTLARPFEVTVDWADDGLLLVPCTAHVGPILFTSERPRTPVLTYTARGVGTLLADRGRDATHLTELLGATRLGILQRLDEPLTTTTLSRLDGHAAATISHHLGVLRRAGLVAARRGGRGVFYRRTALADALLTGELRDGGRPEGRGVVTPSGPTAEGRMRGARGERRDLADRTWDHGRHGH